MELEFIICIKTPVAFNTCKLGDFLATNFPMSVTALFCEKLLIASTNLTAKWQISCVLPTVCLELTLSDELFVANVAGEFRCVVQPPVTGKGSFHHDFATQITNCRLS